MEHKAQTSSLLFKLSIICTLFGARVYYFLLNCRVVLLKCDSPTLSVIVFLHPFKLRSRSARYNQVRQGLYVGVACLMFDLLGP